MIAILRASTAQDALDTGGALIAAGIPVIEISLTTPDALDAIRSLSRGRPDALVGAGTVLDASSARLATLAGARFLVAPTVEREVISTGHRYGAAALPGAQTPTEIEQAVAAGADLVKLFPADDLAPAYAKAIIATMPSLPLVPTGGVDTTNAAAWLSAGAVALGVGGSLTAGGAGEAAERARTLLDALDA